jgi:hypothetical protein
MTKYFKLLGVALIATSLAFVSCGGDDPVDPGTGDPNPPVDDPTNPGTGDVPAGTIAVTFGDTAWTAATSMGVYYPSAGLVLAVAASDASGEAFPRADVCAYAAEGNMTDEWSEEEFGYTGGYASYIEYYHRGALTDGTYNYGDWWAKTVSINITALDVTAMTISANVNAVMFDASAAYVDGMGSAAVETRNMVFKANQLAMQNGEGKKIAIARR